MAAEVIDLKCNYLIIGFNSSVTDIKKLLQQQLFNIKESSQILKT